MQRALFSDEYRFKELAPNVSISVQVNKYQYIYAEDLNIAYDIASLTKVINTYFIVKLFKAKNLSLDLKINNFFNNCLDLDISVRQLLTHTSGLKDCKLEDYSLESVLDNLILISNNKINYADINYILIYYILESLVGNVQVYIELELNKLGIFDIFYSSKELKTGYKYVETENRDTRKCEGHVHDTKAFLMSGISSHAGLFATIHGMTQFGNIILNDKEFKDLCFSQINIVSNKLEKRTLGFEIIDRYNQIPSNGLQLFHTGFTGCSLLVDLKNELVIVILSNYLMYGRNPNRIRKFRSEIHAEIYNWLNYE